MVDMQSYSVQQARISSIGQFPTGCSRLLPIASIWVMCWCSSMACSLCNCFLFCAWKFSVNWSFRDPSMSALVMASPYNNSNLLH